MMISLRKIRFLSLVSPECFPCASITINRRRHRRCADAFRPPDSFLLARKKKSMRV